jgi:hypothetical protein
MQPLIFLALGNAQTGDWTKAGRASSNHCPNPTSRPFSAFTSRPAANQFPHLQCGLRCTIVQGTNRLERNPRLLQRYAFSEPPGSPITAVAAGHLYDLKSRPSAELERSFSVFHLLIVRCFFVIFLTFPFLSLIEGFYHYIEAVDQLHANHYHFSTLII